jgi:hypothetical protein
VVLKLFSQGNSKCRRETGQDIEWQIKWFCIHFSDATLRHLVVSYRRFGTPYRSHIQGSSVQKNCLTLEGGTLLSSETSVTDFLSLEYGSNRLSQKSVNNYKQRCVISQKAEDLVYTAQKAVDEVVRYTDVHVICNILIPGKLRYPTILCTLRCWRPQLLLYFGILSISFY